MKFKKKKKCKNKSISRNNDKFSPIKQNTISRRLILEEEKTMPLGRNMMTRIFKRYLHL
jgi:hypothetical protein